MRPALIFRAAVDPTSLGFAGRAMDRDFVDVLVAFYDWFSELVVLLQTFSLRVKDLEDGKDPSPLFAGVARDSHVALRRLEASADAKIASCFAVDGS